MGLVTRKTKQRSEAANFQHHLLFSREERGLEMERKICFLYRILETHILVVNSDYLLEKSQKTV